MLLADRPRRREHRGGDERPHAGPPELFPGNARVRPLEEEPHGQLLLRVGQGGTSRLGRGQVRDGRGSPPDQAPAGGVLGRGAEDGHELAPAG